MKSKRRIVNVVLGALLVVSLGFALIQLQQLNTAKQALSVIQAEYSTSKSDLDSAKAKLTEVQASLEQATGEINGGATTGVSGGTTVGANATQGPETVVPDEELAAYGMQKQTPSKTTPSKQTPSKQTPAKTVKQKVEKQAPAADLLPGGQSVNNKFDPNDSGVMTDEEVAEGIAKHGMANVQ